MSEGLVRDDDRGGGIVEHIGEAVRRIRRIEREISGAGFEDSEDGDDGIDAGVEADGDEAIRGSAQGEKVAS